MHSTKDNQFTMEKALKKRKLTSTQMFTMLFVLFLMVVGITIGITYSAFQNTATSNGTITFAVNGHQGKIVVDNARVETYNNGSDITTQFTLKPDIGFAVVNSVSCELYSDNYVTKYATYTASPASANTEATQGALTYSYDNNGIGTLKLSNLLLAGDNNFSVLKIVGSATGGTYTITYNKNGGSGGTNSQTATFGADMPTIALPTRTGYIFDGYTVNSDGTGAKYYDEFGATPRQWDRASNTTLYARWIGKQYIVSLDNQCADNTGSIIVNATYGLAMPSITVPTKSGCLFGGYYTSQYGAGTKYYNVDGTSAITWSGSSNITLYAMWMSYIKLTSPTNKVSLSTNNNAKNWDGTLEYCLSTPTNTTTWTTWSGTTTIGGSTKTIHLRGTGNTYLTGSSASTKYWVIGCASNDVSCNGNIMSLLDCTKASLGAKSYTGGNYTFAYLFYNCANLVSAPELPAITLTTSCYQSMFNGCTSLVTAPALPATNLTGAGDCYNGMFQNCTSLVSAPELPATTLGSQCYRSMFSGCTSLTTAPALPATTLPTACYNYMFNGCTSLVSAPALPATTLANSCYGNMFNGCTSLVSAPALPATTLAHSCYSSMFNGCSSLVTAPSLPATTLESQCYYYMFNGCTSLSTLPSLPATTLASYCYYQMFSSCSKIKLSTTQTGEYQNAYRVPYSGTGTDATSALSNMFTSTGGSFKGTPTINTTYYTSNAIINPDGTITPAIV